MKLNEQIKHYRKRAKLTQEKLSEKLFISPKTLSLYETGEQDIPKDISDKLQEILGFKVSTTIIDLQNPKKETENQLVTPLSQEVNTSQFIEDLSEDLKMFLEEFIDDMVEGHLECWQSRYFRRAIDLIEFDLYRQHDFSGEIEFIEDRLERELTETEKEMTFKFFNESVLNEFR